MKTLILSCKSQVVNLVTLMTYNWLRVKNPLLLGVNRNFAYEIYGLKLGFLFLKFIFSILIICSFKNDCIAQRDCGAYDIYDIQNEDPLIRRKRDEIENQIRNFVINRDNQGVGYRIPVVVHIVLPNPFNISDEQVYSQIDVLNEDYNALNTDISNVPNEFENLIGDFGIQFFLADIPTICNGITRTFTNVSCFTRTSDDIKRSSTGGHDPIDPEHILNIWVGDLCGTLLGYGQFPGGPILTDGVAIDYLSFGRIGPLDPTFNLGRTATHEVGHYFYLQHIWGPTGCNANDNCDDDDEVPDTPFQRTCHWGCPTPPQVSCNNGPNGDLFMNYMDYGDDACILMFTSGQITRMIASLVSSRSGLLEDNYDTAPEYCCGLGQDIVIPFNTLLDQDIDLKGNVIVPQGVTLRVKSTLKFGTNKRIIVLKGGKLVLDGAHLTSCSNIQNWGGIQLLGDHYAPQTNENYQAVIESKNGSIVENALIGIDNSEYSYTGAIVKCDNTDFLNCISAVNLEPYNQDNISYFKYCSFSGGNQALVINGIKSLEIKNSNFNSMQYGIRATDSKLNINTNTFNSISDAAIASLATSPGAASLVVTDGNQFINCPNYGITLSGNTANATQEISENYFENCWFAIDIDGDNNYQVRDNRFNSCSYGVLSWASNDFVNEVKCNEMIYTQYGNIYMLYRNSQSSFLGNNFLKSEAGPYKFDFRAYNATIAMEQGDEDHPAMNYFWSTDDIETENSDHFDYYKPNPLVARTDPQNPGNYTEKNSDNDDQVDCGTPPVPYVSDIGIRQLKLNYCYWLDLYRRNPNNIYYKKMFYEVSRQFHLLYYYWSIQNEQAQTWEKIGELLSTMCGQKWLLRSYGLYLYHGDIARAEAILDQLTDPRLYESPVVPDDLSDESRASFIATQRINLQYLKSDTTYVFTNSEIKTLRTEAERNIPERAYARSLYTLATGELLPRILPEECLQPRESDETTNETGWTFSPNPASNTLVINYNGKGEISGKISVYDTDGSLIIDFPARFTSRSDAEINVSSLESGIYLISLTDKNNNVIFKDKFIKIK
ncbi:MAG: T9SS type A sorting domain-containing protein [Saprospiraceae bacterium]|nr:T9SS type A sorting domain-containing protein [Saprospiraceae bacterium]